MVWKPKEKQLTQEEAVALARKELAPLWHNTSPLLAGVRSGSSVTAHPLEADFNKKAWILFFLDPTSYSGQASVSCAREWHRRYSPQSLETVLILNASYGFSKTREWIEELLHHQQIDFPVAVDSDGLLHQAFRAGLAPKTVLLAQQKILFESEGENWVTETEPRAQEYLRRDDPGLSMLPALDLKGRVIWDHSRLEFGASKGARFPAPGFKPASPGAAAVARFDQAGSKHFMIHGTWAQDADRIATSDPQAWIQLKVPASRFSVIAQSLSKIAESARIIVEVNGEAVYEEVATDAISKDDEGQSYFKVEKPGIYPAAVGLPESHRDIKLRFPTADKVAVSLFGLRFGL